VGHLVQESMAAGFEVREMLSSLAPAAFFVAIESLGAQRILGASVREEQRADLHLPQRVTVLWCSICDRQAVELVSLAIHHEFLSFHKPVLCTASARLSAPD
jgi:hypothetical protein